MIYDQITFLDVVYGLEFFSRNYVSFSHIQNGLIVENSLWF